MGPQVLPRYLWMSQSLSQPGAVSFMVLAAGGGREEVGTDPLLPSP